MPLKPELDQHVRGEFEIEMFKTPCEEPACCFFGCLCPCCAVYMQREKLLEITGEDYVCCGGMCPCLTMECPKVPCLCIESCCCSWWALGGNRYLVQTRFGKRNTPCDNFILMFTCIVNWVMCIIRCAGVDVPDTLEAALDLLNCTVFGCMHGQQHREIEKIQKMGYRKPGGDLFQALPPEQQKMIHGAVPSMSSKPGQYTMKPSRRNG